MEVWKKAHELALFVYRVTTRFPKEEIYGLCSQMRRAAVSVPSNVVEGFKRPGVKESIDFFNISQGSLEELKYQLFLSFELGFLPEVDHNEASELADQVGRMLNGYIRSVKSRRRSNSAPEKK